MSDAGHSDPGVSGVTTEQLTKGLGKEILAFVASDKRRYLKPAVLGGAAFIVLGEAIDAADGIKPILGEQFGLSRISVLLFAGAAVGVFLDGALRLVVEVVGRGAIGLGGNESLHAALTILRAFVASPFIGRPATAKIVRAQALRFVRGDAPAKDFQDSLLESEAFLATEDLKQRTDEAASKTNTDEVEMFKAALEGIDSAEARTERERLGVSKSP